ncbi:MAG TPA: ABC transporter substrate-binding protein [Stellaceae bacterium]|nr:ABC transporter substrate-binding protein [Stellaceae bacterium]
MTLRREFLSGAAATGAAFGLPAFIGRARAADTIAFTTPLRFDPTFIDIMNAYSGGHFAREGLACKVLGPPGSAAAFELVLGGQAQFGYIASVDFIRAVGAKGAPLKAFASLSQRVGFHIVSLAEKPVHSGADLKGKTIGVISVGGLSETMVDVVLLKAGLPKNVVTRVSTGNSPGEVELMRKGRIDCFICNFQVAVTLQRSGQKLAFLDIDDVMPAPGALYYTTREMIATKPDLVMRVMRAMKASVQELMTAPLAPIFRRAAKDFDIPRMNQLDAVVAVQKAFMQQLWLAEGRQNLLRNVPPLWQRATDALHQVGIADVKDPTTLYTNQFVDAVMKT